MNVGEKVICRSITPREGSGNLSLGEEYEVSAVRPSRDGDTISVVGIEGYFEALDFVAVSGPASEGG